ncbi:MAG TPA: RsmE family RNA methyltransferase [Thermoanaerobaculia bacterium]|nr:RsmE family RNA methyltransferase [Thermoanaerobaculia bacterium]
MRHRFFVPHVLASGAVVALEGDELHHARVVRLREGEEIEVFDGRGGAWTAIARELPSVELVQPIGIEREPRVALHLAMAIINLDKFELVLQKATELGVRSVIPLITERIEVRAERYRGKGERWQKIVFEAVKQSGRALVPVIESPASFDDVVRRAGTKIVFDADTPPSEPRHFDAATLFVGPEGGWSEEELRIAGEHGCAFARLGPRRLRAETAGIVAVARFAGLD